LKLLLTRPSTALAVIKFGATGIGPATAAFKRGDNDTGIRLFGQAVLGRESFNSMSDERMERVRANFVATESLGSGFAPISPDEVRTVQAPTLLVNGEHSPAIFRHFTDRLEELLPNTQRVTVPGTSHMMQEDNSGDFNARAMAFYDSLA
jgi:pimeloyl-ACP methyl ester carboxylesterase